MTNLLSIVMFFPIAFGVVLALFGRMDNETSILWFKRLALAISLITFVLSLFVLFGFDPANVDYQFVEEHDWVLGLKYRIGVDGISVLFVMLTTFLMPFVIAAGWNTTHRVKEFFVAFLILEGLMIGVFVALDMVLFYVFFEAGLIPMFLIIGIWGGKNRIYASFKFFLYTFLGSVLMLVAMIYMINVAGSSDIRILAETPFAHEPISWGIFHMSSGVQGLLFLAFFASFAVKMPMWPVHTWLPDAHVQAPTAGSVVLAAILLKMGGYGFIRFSLPMFPDASQHFQGFIFALSAIAIVYTSLVALVQNDMKKLIAYSSVAHMGYVTMGIFAFNVQGVEGAIFQMISHGFISAALFLCVGVIYDRMHTREISAFGGLANRMPVYAMIFLFFTMANVGLPGTSGFIGEFLTLVGTFKASSWVAMFATSGVIFSAAYALWLYRRVALGDLIKESLKTIQDVTWRELWLFIPLMMMTLLLGIFPNLVLNVIEPSVENLLREYPAIEAPELPEAPAHDAQTDGHETDDHEGHDQDDATHE